jgi:hypothetical protein
MIYRPLLFGITEYLLAFLVFKYGVFERKAISLFLILLGSYQIGEAIILLTDYDMFGLKFAYFSTTLLPAFGIYFIEKIANKNLLSPLFFIIGLILAGMFIILPTPVDFVESISCILKVFFAENDSTFFYVWVSYYFISLTIGILALLYFIYKSRNEYYRKYLSILLVAYLAFFPTSVVVVMIFKMSAGFLASTMCAMAIITAVLVSYISFSYRRGVK